MAQRCQQPQAQIQVSAGVALGLDVVMKQAATGERDQVLLGVTGSGKTEVYFEAIAAALMGARAVLAVDIDQIAVENAERNIELNLRSSPPSLLPQHVVVN